MKEKEQKIVLVVEDEKPLLDAVRTKLEKSGFSVVTARTADQAYGLLEDVARVDVIWLDHYLIGKQNGLDFVAHIKAEDKYKNIPVFIVSNTASSDKITSYINLGVNQYYVKSNFRLDTIIKDIRASLE